MTYPDYEKLFLLEVLVEEVYIDNLNLNIDPAVKKSLKGTCVMFQFLNYPPLVVCEEDFYKSSPDKHETQLNFKSGKSCLFSMSSKAVPTLPYKFDIKVSVIRKTDQDPTKKIILGTSVINLGDSFAALMHSSVTEVDLPLQKINTGNFQVSDENNKNIGYITTFIRLSCYGQLIVTQFQVGAEQKEFMFRGTEPKQAVDKPGDRSNVPRIEVESNYKQPHPFEGIRSTHGVRQDAVQSVRPDSGYGDSIRDLGFIEVPSELYLQEHQPETKEEGNYKEIVAEIRGHSLHIRVPMKSKKSKDEDEMCKKLLEDELKRKAKPPLNLCDCDFPLAPETKPCC